MNTFKNGRWTVAMLTVALAAQAGCAPASGTVLEQLMDARARSAKMLLGLARSGEASNRAVMAGTDEVAAAAGDEARQALGDLDREAAAMQSLLESLRYRGESELLTEFKQRFAEYRKMNETILNLAVQNTNLKAQRLLFGPAHDAANALAAAVESTAARRAQDEWQARAKAATMIAAVRTIQVLDGPHIAEADDAAMTRLETAMQAAEATARRTLNELNALAAPSGSDAATSALDQFMSAQTEIIRLSRANSNVHSLALSLGQMRKLLAACEQSLQSLEEALQSRHIGPSR